MRHEKTVSVSKIRHLWEPWEEDETPRKYFSHIPGHRQMYGDLMAKTDSKCTGKFSPHFLVYMLLIFRNTDQQ